MTIDQMNANFAVDFEVEFSHKATCYGLNLVSLASLREALPEYTRSEFDAGLDSLRDADLYMLQAFEGRHGQLSAEDRDGGIREVGRLFVYVCRREI
ncbi:MAG: hypothetical protein WC551_07800 [Patescibacteria group bacterium]